MKREANKSKGKAGKFVSVMIEAGRSRVPAKMFKYHRKSLQGRSRKGRRDYPWRKRKYKK